MSRFETISTDLWSRAPFCDLTTDAKAVYLWSRTNPACPMAGIYRVRIEHIALDTSMASERVTDALIELENCGMVRYQDGLLWVCDRAKWLRGRNPWVAKAIARDVAELEPSHPFRVEFLARYATDAWLRDELRPLVAENASKRASAEGQPTLTRGSGDGVETVSDFPFVEGDSETVSGPSPDGHLHLNLHLGSSFRTTANAGRARTREAEQEEVWTHYLATFHPDGGAGPRPTFNETRRKTVADALAVHDLQTCKLAIDGLRRSPHHNGENDTGTTYTDIRYALRGNAERGESHEARIDQMAAQATATPHRPGQRPNLTSAQLVAAERAMEQTR